MSIDFEEAKLPHANADATPTVPVVWIMVSYLTENRNCSRSDWNVGKAPHTYLKAGFLASRFKWSVYV